MTLAIATITDRISRLDVQGLVICDKDEVPASGDPRKAYLIPLTGFVTNFTVERDSFGGGSSAKMTVRYDLNYRLLYAPVGEGRTNVIPHFSGMTDMLFAIFDKVLAIDTMDGLIDILPNSVTNMGWVEDPSAGKFWGCDMTFSITEFVN